MAELRDELAATLMTGEPTRNATRQAIARLPPLAPDARVLSTALAEVAQTDLDRARQLAEQFAATRIPDSMARPRRRAAMAALLVGLVLASIVGAGEWRARTRKAITQAAPSTHVPLGMQQKQVTFHGDIAAVALSPDGKTLAFIAGTDLYLRDLDGDGERRAGSTKGPAVMWLPDGESLAYGSGGSSDSPLWTRIRRDGTVMAKDLAWGWPAPSPDGKRLATAHLTNAKIEVRRLSDLIPERQFELRNPVEWMETIEWSPLGDRLLVHAKMHEQILVVALTLDGVRQELLPLARVQQAHFTPDGKGIIYMRTTETPGTLDLVWAPFDDERLHIAGQPHPIANIRAFAHVGIASRFSISGDSQRLAYVGEQSQESNLWVLNLTPNGQLTATKQITFDTAQKSLPRLSPDGTRIAFMLQEGMHTNMYVMPSSGGERRRLTRIEADYGEACWSPDGKKLAFRTVGTQELNLVDVDNGKMSKMRLQEASSDDRTVVWDVPTRILYQGTRNRGFRILDLPSGRVTALTTNVPGWYFTPVPSPDRRQLLVAWNRAQGGLWLLSADGKSERRLAPNDIEDWPEPMAWSSDGRFVYARNYPSEGRNKPLQLFRVPSEGGVMRPWVSLPFGSDASCSFSGDALRLVCSVPVTQNDVWLVDNFASLLAAARE
jgi:Tol biopolymer transport system component